MSILFLHPLTFLDLTHTSVLGPPKIMGKIVPLQFFAYKSFISTPNCTKCETFTFMQTRVVGKGTMRYCRI